MHWMVRMNMMMVAATKMQGAMIRRAARGVTQENLPYHELVGLRMDVVSASNASIVGLDGRVVDETKSMITIQTADGHTKHVPKQGAMLRFSYGGAECSDADATRTIGIINGSSILQRPFERKHTRPRDWSREQ